MDREEEILEKFRAMTDDDIEIPESLQPECIKERLAEEEIKLNENGKRRKSMKHWLSGTIAAAGALAAAIAIMIGTGNFDIGEMTGKVLTNVQTIAAGKKVTVKNKKKKAKKVAGIKQFKDYKSLYKYFAKVSEKREYYYGEEEKALADGAVGNVIPEMSEANSNTAAEKKVEDDYSKTNTRTEGVDEADIVKTDGKYIYVLKNGYEGAPGIKIIKADNGKMEAVFSKIGLDRNIDGIRYYYNDIMLDGTTLVVFGGGYGGGSDTGKSMYATKQITDILFYDITNPEKPVLKAKHTQEGTPGNTRMKDGIIYTFSSYYNNCYYYQVEGKKAKYDEFVPEVDGKKVNIKCIYVPEYSYGDYYTVVTSIDTKNPEKVIDKKVIMDSGDSIYVSNDNIYFWNIDYYSELEQTKIMKYSYNNGIIEPQASTSIVGRFNDDYSLDEYKGNLRLVITAGNRWLGRVLDDIAVEGTALNADETENALYILDKDLKVTGKIEGLAKGEHIKSARFMGDMAYFVTFRQTDPLFSVDVSDASNPKILGYLKIPGFSEYLHPFGDGLLFGLGQDADELSGRVRGLKLSMFDISNPADVKEIAKKIYSENLYSHSEAEYDRRAIIADAGKNLIGFQVGSYSEGKNRNKNEYIVYGFDREKGFYEKFRVDFDDDVSYYGSYYRGLYIGDYFYVVADNIDKAYSFDIKSGKLLEELEY